MNPDQSLPGGYRIRIVRRTAETPQEISGEWGVHCSLCKTVIWTATHKRAMHIAHEVHPMLDVHQKWIGRVLVGGAMSYHRGYHYRAYFNSARIVGDWTPASVPRWVDDRRRATQGRTASDDLRAVRGRRQETAARRAALGVVVTSRELRTRTVRLDEYGMVRDVIALIHGVYLDDVKIGEFGVLPDGRCFHGSTILGDRQNVLRRIVQAAS